ncbi:MAG: TIGR01841 family phasin [Pseudomonadota bacterium]
MSNNPFDFTKMFTQFDATSATSAMNEQMQKMFSQYQIPNVNMKSIAEAQQKNIDAVTAANRAAFDGMQELMTCQAKIMQEAMKEGADMVSNLDIKGEPKDISDKQTKIVEAAMKKGFENAADLGDIVTNTQKETSKLITERFEAAMKEIKDSAPAK